MGQDSGVRCQLNNRSCESVLQDSFDDLRSVPPPITPPNGDEIRENCHAEPISRYMDSTPWSVHYRILGTYPNHPSQIRKPGEKPRVIDFSQANGPLVLMSGVSVFGNGDDQKWFSAESKAGFAYVALVPTTPGSVCGDFSPIRNVSTSFSRRGEWSEALNRVGDVARAYSGNVVVSPQDERIGFPMQDRYWGAWNQGATEVETVIVGAMPTHVPSEQRKNPNASKQCELGAWYQSYEYEWRPMVSLDGSPEGLPKDTEYLCLRALESEPTPFIQTRIHVPSLKAKGSVLIAHNATDQRSVSVVYGPSKDQITAARQSSLFAITLRWAEPIKQILWDVGGVLQNPANFWKKRNDLAKQYGVPLERIVAFSDEHRREVDLGTMSEKDFWRGALIFAGVPKAKLDMLDANGNASYDELAPYVDPVPGAIEVMKALDGHVPQGILSNDSRDLADIKMHRLYPGLIGEEDVFVISAAVGAKKPEPAIYVEALKRAHLEDHPERVLLIDDSEANCEGARNAGMRCILFENPEQLKRDLRSYGLIVR